MAHSRLHLRNLGRKTIRGWQKSVRDYSRKAFLHPLFSHRRFQRRLFSSHSQTVCLTERMRLMVKGLYRSGLYNYIGLPHAPFNILRPCSRNRTETIRQWKVRDPLPDSQRGHGNFGEGLFTKIKGGGSHIRLKTQHRIIAVIRSFQRVHICDYSKRKRGAPGHREQTTITGRDVFLRSLLHIRAVLHMQHWQMFGLHIDVRSLMIVASR